MEKKSLIIVMKLQMIRLFGLMTYQPLIVINVKYS